MTLTKLIELRDEQEPMVFSLFLSLAPYSVVVPNCLGRTVVAPAKRSAFRYNAAGKIYLVRHVHPRRGSAA